MRLWSRVAWLTVFLIVGPSLAVRAQGIVSQVTASRHGLRRAWVAQVGSPQVTGRLTHVNYDEGLLLVQSSRGMLTALDAETGRTMWATQVGSRFGASSEPAANDKYVVVLNGSTLFVVNRVDGSIAWQKQVSGAPGAGPGVTDTHAFVPLTSGMIVGYDLEKGVRQTPWNYQSTGRVLMPPMTTDETVSWTTEKGYFYVADASAKGIRYRLETRGEIQSRPAQWGAMLFAASIDGFVYGIEETKGNLQWKNSLGVPVFDRPVAANGKVFIVPEFGGMYCLDTATGEILWHASGIRQFVATSPSRVYAADLVGRLAMLDADTGTRLGAMPLGATTTKIANAESDRIFLVDNGCIVQCLHEAHLNDPVIYAPPAAPADEQPRLPVRRAEEAAADVAPPAEDFPAEIEPAADSGNPFDVPMDEAPPAEAADSGNPFAP